ncbi:hypothetical protein MTO96_001169 [Rhipicephalus appendiculatus]
MHLRGLACVVGRSSYAPGKARQLLAAAASAPGAIDLDRRAFPDAPGRVPRNFPVRRALRKTPPQLPAGDAAPLFFRARG